MKKLWSRRADDRGAVLVMAVVGVVLAMISSALAIDLGALAVEARNDQKIADLAALDAVRALPGGPAAVQLAAETSAGDPLRNKFDLADPQNSVVAEIGSVDADGDFVTTGASAVRVTVTSRHDNLFPFVGEGGSVTRRAVAGLGSQLGTVRVGSKLVTLDLTQRTVLNRVLSNVVGGSNVVDADVIGWNGIASGNVSFSRLRTALGLSAGSAEGVLNTSIKYRQLLDATVSALQADGSPSSLAARAGLLQFVGDIDAEFGTTLKLRDLFEIAGNAGNGEDVADASFRVMDILTGAAILADGDHLASGTLLATDSIPSLGLIPNFYSAKLTFGLIEAPQMKSGSPGKDSSGNYMTTATTSQIRARLDLTLRLNLLGIGLMDVTVPYFLNVGNAAASLDALHCGAGSVPTQVDILGSTEQGTSSLGTVTDAALGNTTTVPTPTGGTLGEVALLVRISMNNAVTTTIPGNPGEMLAFTPPYTAESPSQPVSGTPIALPALGVDNLTVATLGLTLLDTSAIELDVVNGVAAAVGPTTINILRPVYDALGLSFGGADVWAPPPQDCTPASFFNPNAPPNPLGVPTLVQ